MRAIIIFVAIPVLFIGGGCINQQKAELASDVAKNWCLSIRASQVLPTYPLTEDLQPGDLFISQQPIEDDVLLYQAKGFLPLTHLVTRIPVEGYDKFYPMGAYGVTAKTATSLPSFWQFGPSGPKPEDPNASPPSASNGAKDQTPLRTNWSIAPRGSFPSYSFSVDQSTGFKAGLPLNGVPIALGVLGSDHAEASVTLGDSYTFGIDEEQLISQVRKWAECKNNAEHLTSYRPLYTRDGHGRYGVTYTYLRLVTRVYYVKKVTVTVRQTRDRSGDLSGGVTQNLKLFGATTNPASDISSILNVLNSGLGGNNAGSNTDAKSSTSGASSGGNAATTKATGESEKIAPATKAATANLSGGDTAASGGAPAIGASLKFANVTATSVSMDETFDRPLVIGFLALDIPIDFNGRLGSRPISTLRRIETAASGTTRHTTHEWAETSPTGIHDLELWINENDNACWLRDNGFTITTRKSTNPNHQDPCAPPGFEVDAKATANTLMQQMRDAGFWVGLKRTLFDGETKNRFGRLGSRIIGEIIDRPPGTGIDFVIAARRLVAAIETKSSDSNSSAAQIKEFNTQADQAQKNISSLDSSERPMLQQKLDVAKTRMNKK